MPQFFQIYPITPQERLIRQAVEIIRGGDLVAPLTDSCYALACHLDDKSVVERLRRVCSIDEKHHLTLTRWDLSELATFIHADNKQYRVLKMVTSGLFVFLPETAREVPHRPSHPSHKTVGLCVLERVISLAPMAELDEPLLSAALQLPGSDESLNEVETIQDQLEKQLELITDGGPTSAEPTIVTDLTDDEPEFMHQDRGDLACVGLQASS